jgi:hypothetical protein
VRKELNIRYCCDVITVYVYVCVFVGRGRGPVHGSGGGEGPTSGGRDEREEEIKRLRNALGSEKNRNKQLITVIERRVLDYQKSNR